MPPAMTAPAATAPTSHNADVELGPPESSRSNPAVRNFGGDSLGLVENGVCNIDALTAKEQEDNDHDEELLRMPSGELALKAEEYKNQVRRSTNSNSSLNTNKTGRTLLVNNVLDDGESGNEGDKGGHKKKKGAFAGVFVPTCENMWGVLIFLRFYQIVGQAGVGQALMAVLLSFSCAFCTTSSMSATVSSGGVVSRGGPYYMISRALGPCVGASVGTMYWLAITMLAVLEVLGAVEGILMISSDAYFSGCKQAYGSALMASLVLFVYGGINLVTKLGIFFVFIVFSTLFMFYFGLIMAPNTPGAPESAEFNPYVTGLSIETLKLNWTSHYTGGASFGYVLSVFFPCFTGILSGANRADILRDPPKNLRQGTFGAIIFSLFMYSSYMILWGMVAHYPYLQGEQWPPGVSPPGESDGRRLAGAAGGTYVVDEIVWNPFPQAAKVGIIISSLSQALQCLVVSPRLLNAIAKDNILSFLNFLAPLHHGEPKRALGATYVVAGLLVLLGNVDMVAPLLSMCFLVAYAFMNFSCFALTWLKSPAWRPKGIQRKRWRCWYMATSFGGFLICLTIMFTIDPIWAVIANLMALSLYTFVNWKLEARGWGSAMDGIRFQLALNSMIQLEGSQKHHVNWRPQVLILYRIHLADELKGIKHHEILRFYSQLRKGNGFCVVACVLEAEMNDEHAIRKARIEKDIIKSIMKEENIQGFAEVVVAPSWVEGTNYIIQLTGIGGLVPNTVLLDWPENWKVNMKKATDFVDVLKTAHAEEKAVLAIRGLRDLPSETVYGTIDIWWMIHDGGFLILLSWLLVQHRIWRACHLRIFTITEGVTEEQAKAAADLLTRTLRQRRLFEVDVEVILADDEMIEPYTYDWTLRVEERHRFLEQLNRQPAGAADNGGMEAIPLEIDDLFNQMENEAEATGKTKIRDEVSGNDREAGGEEGRRGTVNVTDLRERMTGTRYSQRKSSVETGRGSRASSKDKPSFQKVAQGSQWSPKKGQLGAPIGKKCIDLDDPTPLRCGDAETQEDRSEAVPSKTALDPPDMGPKPVSPTDPQHKQGAQGGAEDDQGDQSATEGEPKAKRTPSKMSTYTHKGNVEAFQKLNQIIHSRSKRAQLVVMNLPDLWGSEQDEVQKFMSYCDTLTKGLDRVLFVHSSGHEIFDLSI